MANEITISGDDWNSVPEMDNISVNDAVLQLRPPEIDSVVHHWPMNGGSGSTLTDEVGGADGELSGEFWTSGDWKGGYALEADGSSDYVETTTWGNFGSHMDSDEWAIVFTFSTTENDADLLGSGEELFIAFNTSYDPDGYDDRLQFTVLASGDGNTVQTESTLNDGGTYRAVIQGNGVGGSDVEIWINGEEDYYEVRDDNVGLDDFSSPVTFFDGRNGLAEAMLDNIYVCDGKLTSAQIQADYERQPWS